MTPIPQPPTRKPSVLGLGSALMDLLYHVPEDFLHTIPGDKGGSRLVSPSAMEKIIARLPSNGSVVQGGSAANTIVALAHLGDNAAMLAKIGNDSYGADFLNALASAGVSTAHIKRHLSLPTGRCLSLITPDSERTMRTCMAAAETMSQNDFTDDELAQHTILFVEGYSLFNRDMLTAALDSAHRAGLQIHYDLAAPEIAAAAGDFLPELLRSRVHTIYANESEAAALTGYNNDPEKALNAIAELCPLAIVKLGPDGVLIRRQDMPTLHVPATDDKPVDTTAAGDLWAAGFLHGLLHGWSLRNAAWFGSLTSAAVIQVTGSVLPESTWKQLRQDADALENDNTKGK